MRVRPLISHLAAVAAGIAGTVILPTHAAAQSGGDGFGNLTLVLLGLTVVLAGIATYLAIYIFRGRQLVRQMQLSLRAAVQPIYIGNQVYHLNGKPFGNGLGFSRLFPDAETLEQVLISFLHAFPTVTDDSGQSLDRTDHMQLLQASGFCVIGRASNGRVVELRKIGMDYSSMIILLARDLTESYQRKEALEASESRYREVAEMASDWIWETDTEHRYTHLSGRFEHLTGIAESVLIGRKMTEFVNVREAPVAWRDQMRRMTNAEPFENFRVAIRLPNINERHLRLSGRPRFDALGRFIGYRGIASDFTRERVAEQRASTSRRRMHDAIEAISECIVLFDRQDSFILCNRRTSQEFPVASDLLKPGTGREELLKGFFDRGLLVAPDDYDSGRKTKWNADDGVLREMALPFCNARGQWYLGSLNRTADGGHVLVLANVTDLKNKEMALAQQVEELRKTQNEVESQSKMLSNLADRLVVARNEAESASRAKSTFLASISHELRTPLNAVIGFSDILLSETFGPLGNERYVGYVKDINDSGQHLLELINNVLDLSKVEYGELELQREPVRIPALVNSCVRIADASVDGADIDIRIADDLDTVTADRQKLRQILLNLLSNSKKFTADSGEIVLSAWLENDTLWMEVRDNGIGMKEDEIPQALTPFRQVDNSLGRKYNGTGLGLPLSKSLVELHHGVFQVESQENVGTAVRFSIPQKIEVAHTVIQAADDLSGSAVNVEELPGGAGDDEAPTSSGGARKLSA